MPGSKKKGNKKQNKKTSETIVQSTTAINVVEDPEPNITTEKTPSTDAEVVVVADATATTPKDLVLSVEEIELIKRLRSDDKQAAKYREVQSAKNKAAEEPSAEEKAYTSIFAPVQTLNEVHAHCCGIVKLDPWELRKAVEKAFTQAKKWGSEQKTALKDALANALPSLGKGLVGENDLPVPKSFSPGRVAEAYMNILERHLALTRTLKQRKRDKHSSSLSSSGESASSDEGDAASSKRVKKEEKRSLKQLTKEVEESLRIGENTYSSDHLYECERLLVAYKEWKDPEDGSEQPATCPVEVRDFVKKHLAVSAAPVRTAYDQAHVKGNHKERKHITFLLNRMGYLGSKIAKERLARTGKELNRHGRIRDGAEMSKKARKDSIAGERKWAGEVRWLSVLLSKGIKGYRKFNLGAKAQASQAHLTSAGILPSSTCKTVAAAVASCEPDEGGRRRRGSRSRSRSASRSRRYRRRRNSYSRGRRYGYERDRRRGRSSDRSRGRSRERRERERRQQEKKRCWHCNEKGHTVMNCPSAKKGKPPAKGSRFAKSRSKDGSGKS